MLFAGVTRWWSDIIAEEEENSRVMTVVEWRNEVNKMLRAAPRGQIVNVLASIMKMDKLRAAPAVEVKVLPKTQEEVDWSLWQDMVDEPEKYGDDIIEWLELDESLRAGPKRWRVEAFWHRKVQEMEAVEKEAQAPWRAIYSRAAKEAAVAGDRAWVIRDVKRHLARFHGAARCIQAAVRGHQVRSRLAHLNCCMCLAHRICPLRTDVGMMCRECARQGPYTDITGPVADEWNWFRAEYVDMTI